MRRTALHYASKQGNIVIVEELLKAGSDVTAQDEVHVSELQCPVHSSVCKCIPRAGVVKILVVRI